MMHFKLNFQNNLGGGHPDFIKLYRVERYPDLAKSLTEHTEISEQSFIMTILKVIINNILTKLAIKVVMYPAPI